MSQFLTNYGSVIMMVILIGVMYLLVFLPNKKKEKAVNQMRNNLEVGDIVVTEAGIVGRVISTKDIDTVIIETGSDKTKIKFKRWAIAGKENQ